MLSVEGLDVAYGGSQVLWSVDLDVPDGSVVCLMGRNGVGKTTLLRATMGLLPARAGRVTFDGADITRWSPDRRARADRRPIAARSRVVLPTPLRPMRQTTDPLGTSRSTPHRTCEPP